MAIGAVTRRGHAALALALLLQLLDTAAAAAPPAFPRLPPRGWSSWNSFKLDINEEVVRGSADIMARELLPSGYEYLLIDDGWPPDTAKAKSKGGKGEGAARLGDGIIPVSDKKFPSGFKNLTDYVHSKGLKIGICESRRGSHLACQLLPSKPFRPQLMAFKADFHHVGLFSSRLGLFSSSFGLE